MRRRRVRCRGYSPGPPSPTKEGCSAKVTMSGRSGSRRTVSLRTGNRPALSSGCGSAGLDPRVRLPIVLLLLLLLLLLFGRGISGGFQGRSGEARLHLRHHGGPLVGREPLPDDIE